MTLKAVVFDCDGTLLDSVDLFYAAHRYAALRHGGTPPSREMFQKVALTGKSLHEMFQEMQPGKDHAAMVASNGEYLIEHITDARPFENLHTTLQSLHDMGLAIALVTGGNHRVHDLLQHHEVSDYFTSIVHAERTRSPKPDPEGFLLAMQECGVLPEEAIMVGDTIADILSGKNAGALATVGVTHGVSTRERLVAHGATYVVDGLMELLPLVQKLMS